MSDNCHLTEKSFRSVVLPKDSVLTLFFRICLRNWYWILLSIVLFAGWGVVKYKRAGMAPSTYFTTVMARFPEGVQRACSGGLNPNYNVYDNYTPRWEGISVLDQNSIFNGLCATSLVERVGEKIQYDVNYYLPGKVTNHDFYDHTPIHLIFSPESALSSFTVKMKVEKEHATILSLKGKHDGEKVSIKDIRLPYGISVATPIGELRVEKTPRFDYETSKKEFFSKPIIIVTKESKDKARVLYDSGLRTEESKGRIEMRITIKRSLGFARDFLDGIIEEFDIQSREKYRQEVEEKIALAEKSLSELQKSEGPVSDSTLVSLGITEKERNADSEALRKKLVSMINEYKVDLLTADASSSLIVLDKTKSVPVSKKDLLILIINLIMGLFFPMIIFFVYIVLRNLILVPSELGEKALKRILALLNGNKKRAATMQRDIDLLRLNLTEYLPDSASSCIILTGMSGNEQTERIATELVSSFERKGKNFQILHLEESDAALKEMTALREKGISVFAIAPSVVRSALTVEVSFVADVSLLLAESMHSKRNDKDEVEAFICQSRCPAFVLWLDRY
ncbi:hypothetical protein JFY68_03585 [Porphyromonas gingivalis]|nr:hypothetical protein AT291_07030 [Porphyromonas gingivalis]MCE8172643.1 hypothetical protein [Porphyromonas gingivalis]MCE8174541.1 hypothetical protein [Porphyromonas gingivalis]MCE8176412.1 hypothetical protein [Porphyromonas gingivalis]